MRVTVTATSPEYEEAASVTEAILNQLSDRVEDMLVEKSMLGEPVTTQDYLQLLKPEDVIHYTL